VSESTILDHGYMPEEHAPDPVISHGDPTAPGKIGIWLFLASEIMFFVAILGTYIILRSGAPTMFSRHAEGLNKWLAGINTIVLILSSVTMYIAVDSAHKGNRGGVIGGLVVTFLCACTFMGIKYVEYTGKLEHHTIVARESLGGPLFVYDGHWHGHGEQREFVGYKAPVSAFPGFNINLISEHDVHHAAAKAAGQDAKSFTASAQHIDPQFVSQDITYGPWKNNFYASYFTATGVHGVHVLGGMVPIAFLTIFALRGKLLPHHTEYVGLYWHFVDLVWIFLFPLLYLI
jgi:cytochrome c oxidase subunit 3